MDLFALPQNVANFRNFQVRFFLELLRGHKEDEQVVEMSCSPNL